MRKSDLENRPMDIDLFGSVSLIVVLLFTVGLLTLVM